MGWNDHGKTQKFEGEKRANIKTKKGETDLTNLEENQLGQTLHLSRQILPTTIAMLSWPSTDNKQKITTYASRFFKTGGYPSTDQVQTILKKLELVWNGINNKINIKVSTGDQGVYGYVGFQTGVKGVLRGVFSPRHNLGTRAGKNVSRGDIHMSKWVLASDALSAITFIHEATHKYASTADHGNQGYIADDGSDFYAPGMTTDQALNNADSYAWFCWAVTQL